MPLTKNNPTNTIGSENGAYPAQKSQFNNDLNNGVGNTTSANPGHNQGGNVIGHVNPATRPHGVHDSRAVNAPGATTQVDGVTIPATGATSKGAQSAGEKAFVGKLEHVAGSILCSSTLKAKGIQKEQEAQAMKVQAAELGAAERLEKEAMMRRERAVAHGADPQILHPGGQQSQTADMSNGHDSGAPNMTGVGFGGAQTGNVGEQTGNFGGQTGNLGQQSGNFGGASGPTMMGAPQGGAMGGAPPHAAHMQPGMQTGGYQQGMGGQAYPDSAYPPVHGAGIN